MGDRSPSVDVRAQTDGRPACLLVVTATGAIVLRSDPERCAQQLRPYSTFKIPNSLIALETGIVADASSVIPWDDSSYPKQPWWPEVWTSRTHDLRSALRHSVVPYYREVAKRVGAEQMGRYVRQFRYGNQSIEGSIDSFWLDGEIAISADGQVRFLRDLYHGRLGVSSRTTEIVKEILVRERRGDHTISAKTGTGGAPSGGALGWLVGYVEHGSDVHFFAFQVEGTTYDDIDATWRFERLTTMLAQLGIWPPDSP
ncbi:MAG: class D beta-lactamase [Deltaproteobacteria bacterium]|nr:class D beta-lactamase [Deltaproteobacteria bacterium]MBW2531270.1 class D beta-lactamase [Deltaproteobacteria bacterium]